jgi:hypothetical protein
VKVKLDISEKTGLYLGTEIDEKLEILKSSKQANGILGDGVLDIPRAAGRFWR